ncbi:hypothetical protein [Actinomadura decatromicini]|uniref:Uncharacterized protein n=1 Tax=Actinomadura decatromicini TaxID=2604572 RepID=A0A5D3FQS9_9ACTN|nr:hypothetical protein [Actinomadura decatromicini]TYK50579.1 hypothetical protein FXF68_08665 [Actinomadura decatromicini]
MTDRTGRHVKSLNLYAGRAGMRSSVQYDESEKWLPIGDGYELPHQFTVTYVPRSGSADPIGFEIHFEVIDGAPQSREVRILATPGNREVRNADLRAIPVEEITEQVAAQLAVQYRTDEQGNRRRVARFILTEDGQREGITAVRTARRQVRRRVTNEILRQVAEVYRENLAHAPVRAVAEHFDLGSDRTARRWVQQARAAGHLGSAVKGKAGER